MSHLEEDVFVQADRSPQHGLLQAVAQALIEDATPAAALIDDATPATAPIEDATPVICIAAVLSTSSNDILFLNRSSMKCTQWRMRCLSALRATIVTGGNECHLPCTNDLNHCHLQRLVLN